MIATQFLRRSPQFERAIWTNWDSGCVSNASVPRRQYQTRVLPTLRHPYHNLRDPVCRQRLRVALAKQKRLLETVSCWETSFRHGHRLNTIVPCIIADHTSMRSRKLLYVLRQLSIAAAFSFLSDNSSLLKLINDEK